MTAFRVLHVGDEADGSLETQLESFLEGAASVRTVEGDEAARTALAETAVDCLVCGLRPAFVREIRSDHPEVPVVVADDAGSADAISTAIEAGATDYVARSGDEDAVLAHRIAETIAGEWQQLRGRLTESAAIISGLYGMLDEGDLSLEEKLARGLELGVSELDYPLAYITHREGSSVEIVSVSGDHEVIQENETLPAGSTYCGTTIDTGEPLSVGDAATDKQWTDSAAFRTVGLRCYVGAPIIVDGDVYGTLCFGSDDPRPPSVVDDDLVIVETLAQWVGYEIDRHQYERELQRQIDRLEEFTGVVSHDLRSPLNIAQGRLDIVREAHDSEHVATVDRALDRMEAIIEDTLTLARQGQTVDPEEIEPVGIESVVDHCREIVVSGDSELRLVDEFTMQADRHRLYQLFENLVRNAVEHSDSPVTVRIGRLDVMFTTTRVEPDGTFGFYVEDDGPGIPADQREEVFEPGESTNPQGTGFGLSIVRRIAEAHGWTVSLTESFDGGVRFEFHNVR
ncbi:GAF domain-containing sensor histidine kinase [Halohasta salina]|uniref:GAF domain-containing sensor histidine kinase n=1 Tax=Halohasta salina TaxID=2961621 RepID=UPI0020A61131|nr:ATP-binding protein [Halohasta salina]